MKWNNRGERRKFEECQAKLKEEYMIAGMTYEQIKEMYEYDLAEFNGRRRETEHTQYIEDTEDEKLIASPDTYYSRYAWIDEIEDEILAKDIKKLSSGDVDLLTEYLFEGYSLTEIAEKKGVSQQAVSKKFKKIKNIFKNRL